METSPNGLLGPHVVGGVEQVERDSDNALVQLRPHLMVAETAKEQILKAKIVTHTLAQVS